MLQRPNLDTAASIIGGWTGREEYNKFPSQTSSAISMTTGQLYYFEIHNKENGGGDHATLRWQRPYLTDSIWQDITSIYITDVCDPVCDPKGTPCDDGNANTSDDQWDGNCHCVGMPTANNQNVGERGVLQAYFYDDVSGGNLNTLMSDPDFPTMPDRMTLQHTGLNMQWEDEIDNYGALIQGLLVVPETGSYDFNITGIRQVRFYLSSDHTEANKTANMIETLWGTGRLEHEDPAFNGSQTMTNITLQANTYYYF